MKFGRNLPRNQVPEWASAYINYKGLKKLVKAAAETAGRGETADLAEFFFALDRNLEDVDSFYNKKYADTRRRLRLFQDRYGTSPDIVSTLDQDEAEEVMAALLELRGQLRNLQWFGETNRRGFLKITKKLDKKVPYTSTRDRYLATKVDTCPFARDTSIPRLVAEVQRWLQAFSDVSQNDDARSERSIRSLGRASTKAMLNVPTTLLDRIDRAIQDDHVENLEASLRQAHVDLDEGHSQQSAVNETSSSLPMLPSLSATSAPPRFMQSTRPPTFMSTSPSRGLLLNLLQRAISARKLNVIRFLLHHVSSIDDPDDINLRNCIHRLVIHIGRSSTLQIGAEQEDEATAPLSTNNDNFGNGNGNGNSTGLYSHMAHYATQYLTPATSPATLPRVSPKNEEHPLVASDSRVQTLAFLLDNLTPAQRPSLNARDSFGRLPLHYAAQFGYVVVCEALLTRMQAWGQFAVENGIDEPEWEDNEGYTPLHLSVIGGHLKTTRVLLSSEDWQGAGTRKREVRQSTSTTSAVLAIATKDNHPQLVQLLVNAGFDINCQDKAGDAALHIAARFGHDQCAKILLEGSDLQKANLELTEKSFAWTPLHIAAVDGHLPIARLLVEAGADVDKADSSGWTAREHAALRGHLDIARFLLSNSQLPPGAEELASGRAAATEDGTPVKATTPASETTPPLSSSPTEPHLSLGDRRSNGVSRLASAPDSATPLPPVRTYGHRYLKDETLVLVSLGSMDMRKSIEAVKLDRVPLNQAHHTQLDTALSIVVAANGAAGEPTVVDLPVQENISTEPIVFTTKDVSKVKLLFDIVPTYSGNEKNKIGRGVALLSSVRQSIGTTRMNLQGDVCVPILSSDLDIIGAVNFNFLVITPFSHPNMEVTSQQTYWRKVSSEQMLTEPMVIGHRGLGKNMASSRSLQLGENTVPSFIAAANLGANYVEFDVQLTKDHIPVIYHDFLVSETGIDAPVHTLTLEQFLHINGDHGSSGGVGSAAAMHGIKKTNGKENTRLRSLAATDGTPTSAVASAMNGPTIRFDEPSKSSGVIANGDGQKGKPGFRLPRRAMSMSLDDSADDRSLLNERMKHTRDFKEKGFKANSRGNFIQAPFATLEDLFKQLPTTVGFNIEMKYPMLHESEDHGMDAYAVELNSFCDTVLKKVYDLYYDDHVADVSHTGSSQTAQSTNGSSTNNGGRRNILFSSFNPDICLCLSFKQPNFPILFLTDAGGEPVGDIRASSLQEAIRFARRWNLLGIVSLADPLVISPRLVRVVKQNGLVCVSYGSENNNPEMVQRQVKEGIDAVIVDSVLAIRKGLTKDQNKTAATTPAEEEQKDTGAAPSAGPIPTTVD